MSNLFIDYLNELWNRKSLREDHIKHSNYEYYALMIKSTNFLSSPNIRQRIWHILNNNYNINICPVCYKENKWHPDKREYRKYCSTKCSSLGTANQRIETCLEKYGVTHYSKTDEFNIRIAKTSLEKYGVTHYSKTNDYIDNRKETIQQKYGVDHIMYLDDTKNKIKDSCLEKYGVDHPWKLPEIQQSIRNTCLEKYNNEYPSKTEDIKNKIRETNNKKYGVDYYSQCDDYKIQSQNTCFEKYGVSFSSQAHLTTECIEKYSNSEWLMEQHHNLKKPVYIIAEEIGISSSHLCKIFHMHNIEIKQFFKSQPEKDIYEYIKSLDNNLEVIVNNRTLIYPYELDLVIPSLNLAIEYCGVFYHSDAILGGNTTYHLSKLNKCKNIGIRLIQIFENEWTCQPDIVKSLLANIIVGSDKLYARNCTIQSLESKSANEFYDAHHIQGAKFSSINIGLFYKEKLVSCMSFSKSRLGQYQYELTRFANKQNLTIIGGASKLFKYFIKIYHPDNVLSYCDQRLFTGKIYQKLEFIYDHTSLPNYFYFYQGQTTKLFSREQFQKHKLSKKLKIFDNSLSEWENMKNNKYNRIWDCGNLVFVWGKKYE